MKHVLIYLFLLVGLSYGFYRLTLMHFPCVVYDRFYQRVSEENPDHVNTFRILQAPDENSRLVVKPNPDFIYASAFYNIANNPLRIKGTMPQDTYWSIAFYQPNTVNYFVRNDQEFNSSDFDLIIASEYSESIIKENKEVEVINSPTTKGFILIRLLIKQRDPDLENQMMTFLETVTIESTLH